MKIMLMKTTNFRSHDQSGMASFLIVSVIVVLITLISLGFARLADREERQALDRQLSDEAYYAAESGINDAYAYLKDPSNPNPATINDCHGASGGFFGTNGNIDGTTSGIGKVRYSCLLIYPQPQSLSYFVKAGETKTFSVALTTLDNLYFSWQNNDTPKGLRQPLDTTFGKLPQDNGDPVDGLASDATTGLLRVGLYPIPNNAGGRGIDTNTSLTGAARTYFMYPNSGSVQNWIADYSTSSLVFGNCNNDKGMRPKLPDGNHSDYYCNSKLKSINGVSHSYIDYYISLTAKYKALTVSIEASQNQGPNPEKLLTIAGTEAFVDSTGAGNDVLRRVRAAVPLNLNTFQYSYGIQSMLAICKDFRIPVTTDINTYGSLPEHAGAPNTDGMCVQPSSSGGPIVGGGNP